ncbi:MAG: hypothetical protein WC341_02590 [Bacteroidales bacterium]
MKKNLLVLFMFVAFAANLGAQTLVSTEVQKKNVVLEEFTGIHCQYCPDGHAIAQAMQNENPGRVVLVNIHQGSFAVPSGSEPDFRTPFGDAIANQTGLTGYPYRHCKPPCISRHSFNYRNGQRIMDHRRRTDHGRRQPGKCGRFYKLQ